MMNRLINFDTIPQINAFTAVLGFLSLSFVLLLFKLFRFKRSLKLYEHIPGPQGSFLMGNIKSFNPQENPDMSVLLMRWAKEYGPVFKYRVFGNTFVVVSDLESIKDILVKGQNNYRGNHEYERSRPGYSRYAEIFGLALQNATGDEWKWRRTVLMNTFNARRIAEVLTPYVLRKAEEFSMKLDKSQTHRKQWISTCCSLK